MRRMVNTPMVTRQQCAKAAIAYMNETPFREYAVLRLIGQAFMSGAFWMQEQKQKEDEAKLDSILREIKSMKGLLLTV